MADPTDPSDAARAGVGTPTPAQVAFRGLCPRCGAPTLFDGWARFAPACSKCGLDFASFNVGDGPAAFLTLGIGTIITVLAIWLELAVGPPWWVHVLLWLPLTAIGVLLSLRAAKGALLALEWRNEAREHRSDGQ
ncbi:uncharacterized protein (DUF983 family) [Sphingomonas japonica]|uniref:Uncharacterized protein (DUF983 family) n=1 Tax=Sphingomonas japonica TaxID=511662 RepID=A0ABX0TZN1_9SPHN|nr:uncharacterized protein (DUF983 family) [Sphingomonas japonica]